MKCSLDDLEAVLIQVWNSTYYDYPCHGISENDLLTKLALSRVPFFGKGQICYNPDRVPDIVAAIDEARDLGCIYQPVLQIIYTDPYVYPDPRIHHSRQWLSVMEDVGTGWTPVWPDFST